MCIPTKPINGGSPYQNDIAGATARWKRSDYFRLMADHSWTKRHTDQDPPPLLRPTRPRAFWVSGVARRMAGGRFGKVVAIGDHRVRRYRDAARFDVQART